MTAISPQKYERSNYCDIEFAASDYSTGFIMTLDQIFVTDVGVQDRSDAFYWLALGNHVYDHEFNEMSVLDLERGIDPNDVMNPVILRGHLWKTMHTRLWQVDDGNALGPLPSQPGLDARHSSIYYGDRRARQVSVKPSEFDVSEPEVQIVWNSSMEENPPQQRRHRRTMSDALAAERNVNPLLIQAAYRRTQSLDRNQFLPLSNNEYTDDEDDDQISKVLSSSEMAELTENRHSKHLSLSADSGIAMCSDEDVSNSDKTIDTGDRTVHGPFREIGSLVLRNKDRNGRVENWAVLGQGE